MVEFFWQVLDADTFSYVIVSLLTLWAGAMIRTLTEVDWVAIFFMPAIAFGALLTIEVCSLEGIVFTYDRDSNVVVTSSIGTIIGLVVMLLLTKVIFLLLERRAVVTREPQP